MSNMDDFADYCRERGLNPDLDSSKRRFAYERDTGKRWKSYGKSNGYGRSDGHRPGEGESDEFKVIDEYYYRDKDGQFYLRVQKAMRGDKRAYPQSHWNGKEWKWGKPKGPKIPYFLPDLIAADPETIIWIAEGEKDCETLIDAKLVATTNSEGAGKWTEDLNQWFRGKKHVAIIPDRDKQGARHAAKVARSLTAYDGFDGDIRIVNLPPMDKAPVGEKPHKDVTDWFEHYEGSVEGLKKLYDAAPIYVPRAGLTDQELESAIIVEAGKLPRVVDEAEAALLEAEVGFFVRGAMIVRPAWSKLKAADGRETAGHLILPVTQPHLVETMTRAALFAKYDARIEGYVAIDCPTKVAETYLARVGQWRLPPLAGVINAPALRYDGTVLSEPGYDAATGLLFEPNGVVFPPVPERPTRDDALKALGVLKHLLREFAFVGPADLSVALSAILTALDRRSMTLAPLHAINAPVISSGKTLLIEIASLIATGHRAPVISQGWSDEELEKRMTAALLAGQGIVAIDNCVREVGGDFLNMILTSERVRVRILGKSEVPEVPANATLFANGNNIRFKGDFTRRVVLCSIDPKVERPENRKFDSDPVAEIAARRGEFIVAALTVLRAYHVAKPKLDLPAFASFEDYNYRIIGPLIWLGEANPRDNTGKIIAEDPEREQLAAFMEVWWDRKKDSRVRARDLTEMAGFDDEEAKAILKEIAGDQWGGVNSRRLSKYLARNKDRIVDRRRIVEDGLSEGTRWWRLVPVK